jgi:hydrogenase-4 membrane subunit HyfE
MLWCVLLVIALLMAAWSRKVQEDVHAIAAQLTGLISLIWGYSWAPPSVQLIVVSLGSIMLLRWRLT